MAIATSPGIVIDCPDIEQLGRFYADILDWKLEVSDGWADLRSDDGQCISFQQVSDFRAPDWPGQNGSQQMHLDLMVEDLDAAEAAIAELGARKHEHQPGETFRVYLDRPVTRFASARADATPRHPSLSRPNASAPEIQLHRARGNRRSQLTGRAGTGTFASPDA